MNLTQSAGLEPGEFDFNMAPALGGPLMTSQEDARELIPALEGELFALSTALDDREVQLDILSELIQGEQVRDDATLRVNLYYLAGCPRISVLELIHSAAKAWHEGIDFAGREGSDIIAVASGVVSWSGERYGYGKMVEVAHGDGVITRYAHNQENLVKVGDMVRRGDVVALMGNSGRSTGPHVHFEVHKTVAPSIPQVTSAERLTKVSLHAGDVHWQPPQFTLLTLKIYLETPWLIR